MAIKTKNSRDTYRSNVKIRPLQQNGLEAQYQGLDITEVNIDHAGLAIIGRGGFQTRRNIKKVRKQYIIDVDAEEHFPTAEIVFSQAPGSPFNRDEFQDGTTSLYSGIQDIVGATFTVTDQANTQFTFEYVGVNGLSNQSNTAIDITGNNFSARDFLSATTGSIQAAFPENTFGFEIYVKDSEEVLEDGTSVKVPQDKIKLRLQTTVNTGTPLNATITESNNPSYFDVTSNTFSDQRESHQWRLNGYLKDNSNERMFYEDLRVDTIQSVVPHSVRRDGSLFRMEQFPSGDDRNNYDANIDSIAGDPTAVNTPRFSTHDSEEVLIRQYPKREEILGTYKDSFAWHEDPHYVLPDQQTWSIMSMYAEMYSATLEQHIERMFAFNFVNEQYVEKYPMSGRVDVFERLSRVFDIHPMLTHERHKYSVFTQYLDPQDDFINLRRNKLPTEDRRNRDVAFEDVKGVRSPYDESADVSDSNPTLFIDYFDQEPLENHKFIEEDRYTRIDQTMLEVITKNEAYGGRSVLIDRREWQEGTYIHTATGFINSQVTGQDGIIYREMKR